MAIGQASDFVIYQEQFHTGVTEVMTQQANVFNEASNGAITLRTRLSKGDFIQQAFYQELANLVTRRNTASVAAADIIAMTQEEDVSVKLNRKIGPVVQTLDSFRKIAQDPMEMSYVLGTQWGKAIMLDYVNTAIAAADVAFAQTYEQDNSTATINHAGLVSAMAKFGDAGQNVVAFVMHSKPFYDLMQQSIADKIFEVAGVTIHTGTVASLNRPIIVSDIAGLIDAGSPNKYHTLALTRNAISVEESEGREIASDLVLGLEQMAMRYQGEYAYNVGLKGYSWNIAGGGKNPTAGALTTEANWLPIATDDKNTGGVRLITL